MGDPLSVADYERLAEERLEPGAWAYLAGGSGDEWTLRENRAAFERWTFRPRVLRDVSDVSTAATVLGTRLELPVLVAPVAYQQLYDPDGECATARAANRRPWTGSNPWARVPLPADAAFQRRSSGIARSVPNCCLRGNGRIPVQIARG